VSGWFWIGILVVLNVIAELGARVTFSSLANGVEPHELRRRERRRRRAGVLLVVVQAAAAIGYLLGSEFARGVLNVLFGVMAIGALVSLIGALVSLVVLASHARGKAKRSTPS
jgi:hypothetical protein